jgi:hypothetical protein
MKYNLTMLYIISSFSAMDQLFDKSSETAGVNKTPSKTPPACDRSHNYYLPGHLYVKKEYCTLYWWCINHFQRLVKTKLFAFDASLDKGKFTVRGEKFKGYILLYDLNDKCIIEMMRMEDEAGMINFFHEMMDCLKHSFIKLGVSSFKKRSQRGWSEPNRSKKRKTLDVSFVYSNEQSVSDISDSLKNMYLTERKQSNKDYMACPFFKLGSPFQPSETPDTINLVKNFIQSDYIDVISEGYSLFNSILNENTDVKFLNNEDTVENLSKAIKYGNFEAVKLFHDLKKIKRLSHTVWDRCVGSIHHIVNSPTTINNSLEQRLLKEVLH